MHQLQLLKFKNIFSVSSLLLTSLVTAMLLLTACGGGDSTTLPESATNPTITSKSPGSNQSSVSPQTRVIRINFSKPMNIQAREGWITLKQGSTTINGTINSEGDLKSATFTLAASINLEANKTYTVSLITSGGILKDSTGHALAGNTPAGNYIWNFTTGSAGGSTAGKFIIIKQVPINQPANSTGKPSVPLNTNIRVVFNEDVTNLVKSNFTLKQGNTPIPGKPNYSSVAPYTFTFNPTDDFASNTLYEASFRSFSASGNTLDQTSWKFTSNTQAPQGVTPTFTMTPGKNSTAAAQGFKIQVQFDQQMEPKNHTAWVSMYDNTNTPVSGVPTYNYNDVTNTFTYTPASLPAGSYTFVLNIAGGIITKSNVAIPADPTDLSGNLTHSVTLTSTITNKPPTFTMSPNSGTFPSLGFKIVVTFSTEMNYTAGANWVSMLDSLGNNIFGTGVYSLKTFTFTPNTLAADNYTFSLNTAGGAIVGVNGIAVPDSSQVNSVTITSQNTTPPPTATMTPQDGSLLKPGSPLVIVVTFQQQMNVQAGTAGWITVNEVGGAAVIGIGQYDGLGNTFTYTVDALSLVAGSSYSFTLNSTIIKDTNNVPLTSSKTDTRTVSIL